MSASSATTSREGPPAGRADDWLRDLLCAFVAGSPLNRVDDREGRPIFDAPLLGVAAGDDPLFAAFRDVVAPGHLMPREALPQAAGGVLRVVSWALPFTEAIRRSNRGTDWPSELYSLARNNAGAFLHAMHGEVVARLRGAGFHAAAPCLDERYTAFRCATHTFASTWSERHAAFAAGLGRFGLSAGLITAAGMHVRFGSVVTDLPLTVTPRHDDEHRAPCLATGGRTCGACIARCPVGAVGPSGLDKERCQAMRTAVRERFLEDYRARLPLRPSPVAKNGTRAPGYSLGCALCQCGVPCEARNPF